MQIFLPYSDVYKVAECLDPKRLNNQINEASIILDAIEGKKAWRNHPVVLMYKEDYAFIYYYRYTLIAYKEGFKEEAKWWSIKCDCSKPDFVNETLTTNHKQRLYTKNPEYYKDFESFGSTDVNKYFVDGEWREYINGKRIK